MLDSCLLFRLDSTILAEWRERGLTSALARGNFARFARDERGSVTVESVLWLPVFLAFLGIAVDASVIFSNRSLILRTIQDANRMLAIGRFDNEADTEQFVQDNLQVCPLGVCPPEVTVTTTTDATGVITTRVEVPAEMIDAIGLFGLLTGFNVAAEAEYMSEE
jgi:Flp pilus assembly protein TadG